MVDYNHLVLWKNKINLILKAISFEFISNCILYHVFCKRSYAFIHCLGYTHAHTHTHICVCRLKTVLIKLDIQDFCVVRTTE